MSKVDRRIQKTRTAINKAFLELLSEKDFDQITINDISDRANINRGTLYLHFKDKYDLLDKCIEEQLNTFMIFNDSITYNHKNNDGLNTFVQIFDYFEKSYSFYSVLLNNKDTPFFRDHFKNVVINGISKELSMEGINQNFDRNFLIQYISSALVGIVEWWIKEKMPLPPRTMARYMSELYKRNEGEI